MTAHAARCARRPGSRIQQFDIARAGRRLHQAQGAPDALELVDAAFFLSDRRVRLKLNPGASSPKKVDAV